MTKEKWIVIDCPFNQAWYPGIIGKKYDSPPSYALVLPESEAKKYEEV